MKYISLILLTLLISGCSLSGSFTNTHKESNSKNSNTASIVISKSLFTIETEKTEFLGSNRNHYTCIPTLRTGIQKVYTISNWHINLTEYMGDYMMGDYDGPCITFNPSRWALSPYDIPTYYISGNKVLPYTFMNPDRPWLPEEYRNQIYAHDNREEIEKIQTELNHKFFQDIVAHPELLKQYEYTAEQLTGEIGLFNEYIEYIPHHKPIVLTEIIEYLKSQGIEFFPDDPNEEPVHEIRMPHIFTHDHKMIAKSDTHFDFIYFFKEGYSYYYRYRPRGEGGGGWLSDFAEVELFME